MKIHIETLVMTGLAAVLGGSSLTAQVGQSTRPPTAATPQLPAPTTGTPKGSAVSVTMSGCLYNERDVPGRTPNVAERAGVLEDFILADARATHGSLPPGITGTMYEVNGVPAEQLKGLVGKRVEVTGHVDPIHKVDGTKAAGATKDRNPISPDDINLPEFQASSIREVTGASCPARPAAANPTRD